MDNKCKARSIKACDRCRIKKVKCDGAYPCVRCTKDDVTCIFGRRGKANDQTVSVSHVEQLQLQNDILTRALKAVWSRFGTSPETDGTKELSTHEICSLAGVLDGDLQRLCSTSNLSQQSSYSDIKPTAREDTSQDSDMSMSIESSPSINVTRDVSPTHITEWPSFDNLPSLANSDSSVSSDSFSQATPMSAMPNAMPSFKLEDQQYFQNTMYPSQSGFEPTFYSDFSYDTFYNDVKPAPLPPHFRDTFGENMLSSAHWAMPVPN